MLFFIFMFEDFGCKIIKIVHLSHFLPKKIPRAENVTE